MNRYFLPGQRYQWEIDRSVSRWRGFFVGVILTLLCSLAFDILYLIPKTQQSVKSAYESEVDHLRASNQELRDEVGLLTGVIVSSYGKEAKRVVESYRGRRK